MEKETKQNRIQKRNTMKRKEKTELLVRGKEFTTQLKKEKEINRK